MRRPRVLILRGTQANPWDLRPWENLTDRFDVRVAVPGSNRFDVSLLELEKIRLRAWSDAALPGRLRRLAARSPVNRYVGLARHLSGVDIVHAADLRYWFSDQAARHKARFGYRLVLTAWETIPFRGTYRNAWWRRHRARTLPAADLFLATTERARDCLLMEDVPAERIQVAPPGVDLERFGAAARPEPAPQEHLIVSPARLIWAKGQQDVLRAVAALHRGLVRGPRGETLRPRLLLVGAGPEERRLAAYAADLGIAHAVEHRRAVPYGDMPAVYAGASCMVLASLPIPTWEEQFGMVLPEAMAAGLPIVASASGAIPEVAGDRTDYFSPGDWLGLARALAAGPLARPPATRVERDPARLRAYSSEEAGKRLAAAYEHVLAA